MKAYFFTLHHIFHCLFVQYDLCEVFISIEKKNRRKKKYTESGESGKIEKEVRYMLREQLHWKHVFFVYKFICIESGPLYDIMRLIWHHKMYVKHGIIIAYGYLD